MGKNLHPKGQLISKAIFTPKNQQNLSHVFAPVSKIGQIKTIYKKIIIPISN